MNIDYGKVTEMKNSELREMIAQVMGAAQGAVDFLEQFHPLSKFERMEAETKVEGAKHVLESIQNIIDSRGLNKD